MARSLLFSLENNVQARSFRVLLRSLASAPALVAIACGASVDADPGGPQLDASADAPSSGGTGGTPGADATADVTNDSDQPDAGGSPNSGGASGGGGAGGAGAGGTGSGGSGDAGVEADSGPVNPTCPSSVTPPAAFTGVNSNPAFVQVYVNNVENLQTTSDPCPGDWKDLFYYMKLHPSPDVFLVQQLSGQTQLNQLVQYMTDNLAGVFAGVIAEANPKVMNSPCGAPKDYQTNAIIYRTGRLQPLGGKQTFQVQAFYNGACQANYQSRTIAVKQRFHDLVANKDISVVSMHWSTFSGTGADPACAEANAAQVDKELAALGGELLIWGGDANEGDRNASDNYKPWYQAANGDLGGKLGHRDAIFSLCAAGSAVKACLANNWTIGSSNRIDFLFAKRGDGCKPMFSGQHTISFAEAGQAAKTLTGVDSAQDYSDHRAVRAAIHY